MAITLDERRRALIEKGINELLTQVREHKDGRREMARSLFLRAIADDDSIFRDLEALGEDANERDKRTA